MSIVYVFTDTMSSIQLVKMLLSCEGGGEIMEDKSNPLKRLCFVLIACRKKRTREIGLGCVIRVQFVRGREQQ